jgi:hypothetical protein
MVGVAVEPGVPRLGDTMIKRQCGLQRQPVKSVSRSAARGNSQLGEYLPQVGIDGAGAQIKLGGH